MDCSTPGVPVHHQLSEFSQTHVHWVGDAIQPSHPLLSPSFPASDLSQHQGLFKWVSSSHQVAKMLEFQFQHQSFQWIFRTGWISFSPRDSQESFPTPLFQSINSLALNCLYSPTLTSIHDYLILVDAIIIPFCKEENRGSKSLKNSSSITKWWGWCWNLDHLTVKPVLLIYHYIQSPLSRQNICFLRYIHLKFTCNTRISRFYMISFKNVVNRVKRNNHNRSDIFKASI